MKWKIDPMALFVIAVLVGGAGLLISEMISRSLDTAAPEVMVPDLSEYAKRGESAFNENCAACHGANAAGTDNGPPLVHDIYNPGHHADDAFFLAVQRGARQHHWAFGNMPPQRQVREPEIRAVVQYIRELQTANGITYRQHRM